MCLQILYIFPIYIYIYIYMYKQDLALDNLQWLLYYKTKPNRSKPASQAVPGRSCSSYLDGCEMGGKRLYSCCS